MGIEGKSLLPFVAGVGVGVPGPKLAVRPTELVGSLPSLFQPGTSPLIMPSSLSQLLLVLLLSLYFHCLRRAVDAFKRLQFLKDHLNQS